jgi:SSS family solute:Na+ symporter
MPGNPLGGVPFMMMAFYLFIACVLMQVTFSYIYPATHTTQSRELFWKSVWEPLQGKGWNGLGNYKTLSVLLLLVMGVLYWFFR